MALVDTTISIETAGGAWVIKLRRKGKVLKEITNNTKSMRVQLTKHTLYNVKVDVAGNEGQSVVIKINDKEKVSKSIPSSGQLVGKFGFVAK